MDITPTDCLDKISARRSGGVVTLLFGKASKAITPGSVIPIATIPEPYRPRFVEKRMVIATVNGYKIYFDINYSTGILRARFFDNIPAGTEFNTAIMYSGA